MKLFLKACLRFCNTVWLNVRFRRRGFRNNSFLWSRINNRGDNCFAVEYSHFSRSSINCCGYNNRIQISGAQIEGCFFSVAGTGNLISLEPGVKLRNTVFNIRGSNCAIRIGEGTSFGGARLVNVGKDNSIDIGRNGLLADNIEIWASDTHAIRNDAGELLNPEQPIVIDDHVWIGMGVRILKGVRIGSNAVVGMGSLVTRDLKPGTLNVGSPARCIRENINWSLDYERSMVETTVDGSDRP